jgi:hypothetical protein
LEKAFAAVESKVAPVWPDIVEYADKEPVRREVAFVIALLFFLRHPDHQAFVADRLQRICAKFAQLPPQTKLLFRQGNIERRFTAHEYLANTKLDPIALKETFLDFVSTQAGTVGDALAKRPWGVICAENDVFLTSDFPVVFKRGTATQRAVGVGTPGTEITFPLSPRRVLHISEVFTESFGLYQVTDPDAINSGIARVARRFVFANRDDPSIQPKVLGWRSPSASV